MTNKISDGLKKISILTLSIIIIFILFSQISLAIDAPDISPPIAYPDPLPPQTIKGQLNAVAIDSGYDSADKYTLINNIADIIKSILALLGIIFLILIIMSGFQWMMAGGNEEAITKAKNRIKNATIGLAIVILSYSISYFIFSIIKS